MRNLPAKPVKKLTYERLLAPLDGFATTVQQFVSEGGSGQYYDSV